jgi:hypothetical protein
VDETSMFFPPALLRISALLYFSLTGSPACLSGELPRHMQSPLWMRASCNYRNSDLLLQTTNQPVVVFAKLLRDPIMLKLNTSSVQKRTRFIEDLLLCRLVFAVPDCFEL